MEEKEKKPGFGALTYPGENPLLRGVYDFLELGYPRLALARAKGIPFAPYLINVRATFDASDVTVIPNQGSDVKIVQDTLITGMITRVTNDTPAANVLDPQSRFFDQYMNGLEATLTVQGQPRYEVAPFATPLSNMGDLINTTYPKGWVLTYQEQLYMSFFTRFALAHFPTTVICTFRGFIPVNDMFVDMPVKDAIDELRNCGVIIPDCYTTGLVSLERNRG